MPTVTSSLNKERCACEQGAGNAFGLITETDDRPELHGFEVDMAGNVIVPELRPRVEKRTR